MSSSLDLVSILSRSASKGALFYGSSYLANLANLNLNLPSSLMTTSMLYAGTEALHQLARQMGFTFSERLNISGDIPPVAKGLDYTIVLDSGIWFYLVLSAYSGSLVSADNAKLAAFGLGVNIIFDWIKVKYPCLANPINCFSNM